MGAESAPKTAKWGQKAPPKCQSGGKKRPRNSDTTKSGLKVSIKVGAESAPKVAKWGQKTPPLS